MKRETEEGRILLTEKGETVLSIEESSDGKEVLLVMQGKLTRDASPELEDELTAILAQGANVRADLRQVSYVSSTCANMFVRMQKIIDTGKKRNSIVFAVSPEIYKLWEQEGVTDCVEVEV